MQYIITFPVQPFVTGDTVQLIMSFYINVPGDDLNVSATEHGLTVLEWPKNSIEYDMEKAFAMPAHISITLGDIELFLHSLIFESSNINLQGLITIKVNGSDDFAGNIIEDTIDYNIGDRALTFSAAPKMDVIEKTNLYKQYQGETVNTNPFVYTENALISIVTLLEDIFQLADSTISYPTNLSIFQDWLFFGIKQTFGGFEPNIPFTDIQLKTNNISFNPNLGITSVGDLLRLLALEFGAFTGFIRQGHAFFKKLFYYNANNLQNVRVNKHRKKYKYGLIDYVEIKVTESIAGASPYAYAPSAAAFTDKADRFINQSIVSFCSTGDYTTFTTNIYAHRTGSTPRFILCNAGSSANISSVYSNNGSQFTVNGTFTRGDSKVVLTVTRTSGTNNPQASGVLTKVSGTGDNSITFTAWETETGDYTIGQVFDPSINLSGNNHDVLAQFLYHFRGNMKNCRVDYFECNGIDYDFLKDFNYGGYKYQPVKMVKHYAQLITEIEAIYLGAV